MDINKIYKGICMCFASILLEEKVDLKGYSFHYDENYKEAYRKFRALISRINVWQVITRNIVNSGLEEANSIVGFFVDVDGDIDSAEKLFQEIESRWYLLKEIVKLNESKSDFLYPNIAKIAIFNIDGNLVNNLPVGIYKEFFDKMFELDNENLYTIFSKYNSGVKLDEKQIEKMINKAKTLYGGIEYKNLDSDLLADRLLGKLYCFYDLRYFLIRNGFFDDNALLHILYDFYPSREIYIKFINELYHYIASKIEQIEHQNILGLLDGYTDLFYAYLYNESLEIENTNNLRFEYLFRGILREIELLRKIKILRPVNSNLKRKERKL